MNPTGRPMWPLALVCLASCTSVQNHPGGDAGADAGADASHDGGADAGPGDAGPIPDGGLVTDPWRDCFEALELAPTGAPCDFTGSCSGLGDPGAPERRATCINGVVERNVVSWHCPTEPPGTPPYTDCAAAPVALPGDACVGFFWCGELDEEECVTATNCTGDRILRQRFCTSGEAVARSDAETWSECPPDELPVPSDRRPRPGDLCDAPFACVVRGSSVRYGSEYDPVFVWCAGGIVHFGPQRNPGFDPALVCR